MKTKNEVEEKVWEILDNLGVVEKKGDVMVIHNEEIDSIQLVSIIVEIEENFGIEIPDEYMNPEFLLSFDHIVDIVEELLNNPYIALTSLEKIEPIADALGND